MEITIITRDGDVFSTQPDRLMSVEEEVMNHFTIISDSYMFQESVRIVKFNNATGERITIPLENINSITEKKD